ncbi:BRO family protein, partial [Clostridium perfringens]|uniref:BRO family protein n=1 Tax=Clostridium perfringens TaxID=1502 RepID=UPI001B1879F3|nr:DNA damage-inducible protein D [Clostridium perfringens]
MREITNYNTLIFEDIKHTNEYGQEFWYGRELSSVLEYNEWRNFLNVVKKAKTACESSGFNSLDHFVDVTKMVNLGSSAKRKIEDI